MKSCHFLYYNKDLSKIIDGYELILILFLTQSAQLIGRH